MALGGAHGDEQPGGDLRVGQPVGDQIGDLQLPSRSAGTARRAPEVAPRRRHRCSRANATMSSRSSWDPWRNSSRNRSLAQQPACLLEAVGAGRREREGVAGLRHPDDVPDALGRTQQERCSLTHGPPRWRRGRASPGRRRCPSGHRVRVSGRRPRPNRAVASVEAAGSQLVLTEPGHGQRLHVALADLVRAGDALPMPVSRLPRRCRRSRGRPRPRRAPSARRDRSDASRSSATARSACSAAAAGVPSQTESMAAGTRSSPSASGVIDGGGDLGPLVDQVLAAGSGRSGVPRSGRPAASARPRS